MLFTPVFLLPPVLSLATPFLAPVTLAALPLFQEHCSPTREFSLQSHPSFSGGFYMYLCRHANQLAMERRLCLLCGHRAQQSQWYMLVRPSLGWA